MDWTIFFIISSGILFIICCILGYIIRNLLIKQEKAEDIIVSYVYYLDKLSTVIEASDQTLQKLDHSGAFKSDDEVGFFFKALKDMQELLNEFKVKKI